MTVDSSKKLEEAIRKVESGQYDTALTMLETLIQSTELSSPVNIRAHLWLGEINWQKGRYENARSILRKAEEQGMAIEQYHLAARAIRLIGNTLIDQGALRDAEEHYRLAMELFTKADHKKGIARCLNNLGVCRTEEGDYEAALDYFYRSLKIHEELDDNVGIGMNKNNIGEVHRFRGDHDLAEKLYRESLRIDEDLGDRYGAAIGWGNLGAVSFARKDYEEAEMRVQKAVDTFEEMETFDLVYVEITGLMAGITTHTKRFDISEKFIKKIRKASKKMKSDYADSIVHFYEGLLAQKKGNLSNARESYNKCLVSARRGSAFEYEILSSIQLVELELLHYRLTLDEDYLDRMENQLSQVLTLADKHKLVGAEIELKVLHGLLLVESGELVKGLNELNSACDICQERGFEKRISTIEKQTKRVKKRLESSADTRSEKIEDKVKRMQEYIEECQRLVLAGK
ncbi:MAG: tetratricopeptide repeat protein [Candidatus Lokiarchaeota archaeon]|nr:tetratricopeptide repeat protein [Candidatus Lokiarchaeota archaeon]